MKKMRKTKKKWPKAAHETVERLVSELSEDDKKALRYTPNEELIKFHFRLGMYIKNTFVLLQENRDLLKSCCVEDYSQDPDAAYTVIIEALWKKLHDKLR